MLPEQTAGMFCQGARVRVKGLTARPELNGERGRILAFHAERGRYAVAMHVSNERILLKPVNLEPAMDAACEAAVAFATDQCLASTEGRRKEIDEPDGLVAFDEACEQAMAALAAMDPSSAASAARRAIALRPSSCAGHLLLADSANYGGDLRAAATGRAACKRRSRLRCAAAHYPGLLGLWLARLMTALRIWDAPRAGPDGSLRCWAGRRFCGVCAPGLQELNCSLLATCYLLPATCLYRCILVLCKL